MKHMIIFLGYGSSRLDNPVYRKFTQSKLYPKEVILLFLTGRLDERELVHRINELQKNDKAHGDITFHLCSNLYGDADGEAVLHAARIIRRQPRLQPDGEHLYPLFVYALMPTAEKCEGRVKQTLWHNLGLINQSCVRYHDCPWLQCVYLYSDATHQTLSDFLFYTISAELPATELFADGGTQPPTETGEADTEAQMFAPVFGSFNSFGVKYPEVEVRHYLRLAHLAGVLRCADSGYNETTTADCIRHAEELSRFVPTDLISLALNGEQVSRTPIADSNDYLSQQIAETIETLCIDLKELSRQDWTEHLVKEMEASYQSRLLPGGVDFYFAQQEQRCHTYSEALCTTLSTEFDRLVCARRLPTDALRQVVRALVNLLQQRVLELQHLTDEAQREVTASEHYVRQLEETWQHSGIFSRITGKDQKIWEHFTAGVAEAYRTRVLVRGYHFAMALLNEVIVNLSVLDERCAHVHMVMTEATTQLTEILAESSPAPLFGIFDSRMLSEAIELMKQDQDVHMNGYSEVLPLLFGAEGATDSYDFLSRVRRQLQDATDGYLDSNIAAGRFPALLNCPVVTRLQQLYATDGGFDHFVRVAKEQASLPLRLKEGTCGNENDRYLLLSAVEPQEAVYKTLCIGDTSRVELLHLLCGVSLARLDGFAGYRIAFEPAMF